MFKQNLVRKCLRKEGLPCVYEKLLSKTAYALQEKIKLDERYPDVKETEALGLWVLVKHVPSVGVHSDH